MGAGNHCSGNIRPQNRHIFAKKSSHFCQKSGRKGENCCKKSGKSRAKRQFYIFLTLQNRAKMIKFEWVKICGFIRYANILSKGRIS